MMRRRRGEITAHTTHNIWSSGSVKGELQLFFSLSLSDRAAHRRGWRTPHFAPSLWKYPRGHPRNELLARVRASAAASCHRGADGGAGEGGSAQEIKNQKKVEREQKSSWDNEGKKEVCVWWWGDSSRFNEPGHDQWTGKLSFGRVHLLLRAHRELPVVESGECLLSTITHF